MEILIRRRRSHPVVTCPACGNLNPQIEGWCVFCGAPLAGLTPEPRRRLARLACGHEVEGPEVPIGASVWCPLCPAEENAMTQVVYLL